ncbi:MAG TPA: M1 family peptidase [bacterium]|nr:M1 family peptidase [bacterium]
MRTDPRTPLPPPFGLLALAAALTGHLDAQIPATALATAPAQVRAVLTSDTRAIRRDVPLTRSIRRALRAGTRDFTGHPGANYWQLQTDFDIDVRLDAPACTLHGRETIAIHNHSPDDLHTIALRLDHNIFRFGVERGSSVPAERTDGMVITHMAIDDREIDLHAAPRRRRGERSGPTVRGLERTVATILLEQPVEAGTTAHLEIHWHTKLPGGDGGRGHRMTQRWNDTLFQPTQWFPRLCKYDDLHGWVTQPYLGPAEFYNNFGSFDVAIDVPAGWLVSGTGELQNADEVLSQPARDRLSQVLDSDDEIMIVTADERGAGNATADGEQLTWRFHADLVNDFAWATARDYVWRATRATIPGKGPVPIHMLYLPERARRFQRAGTVTRHALEFYSSAFGAYPFPQLTLQDGPSAGMEYPMVINSNQGAADHETAHQWWPMMVGTNETMYGWMDEGFNTYMNILSGAHRRGRAPSLDGRGASYGRRAGDESEPPMMWTANYAGSQYGFQTYMKAPMMLSMLGGIVGDEAVRQAMQAYAETWAFKHPSPWDFVFFMQDRLDVDLGWFFYYWLWTTESVDGSIRELAREGDTWKVTVHQAGQMPSPIVLLVEFAEDGPPPRLPANARARADGKVVVTVPVDVWFDGRRAHVVPLDFGGHTIAKIELDPGGRFPDGDRDDNVWPR